MADKINGESASDRSEARRKEINNRVATVATTPIVRERGGMLFNYSGGDVILSIGGDAFNIGANQRSKELAEEIASRWNDAQSTSI